MKIFCQFIVCCLLAPCPVVAAQPATSLLENSPFMPQGQGPVAAAAAPETPALQLRGVVKMGQDVEFNIFDPSRNRSTWARLNESGRDFVVKSYDAGEKAVMIEHIGRRIKLTLSDARDVASANNRHVLEADTAADEAGRRAVREKYIREILAARKRKS